MKVIRILFSLILAAGVGSWADTLWTPSFDGYLSARSALGAGDIVYVQIDGATSLSFQAAASDEALTLEFSGGQFGSLLSFLPQTRSGGELSSRGRQQYTIESRFAARVAQVDGTGKARIEGTRSVTLEESRKSGPVRCWLADLVSGRMRSPGSRARLNSAR
jgi:flagellar basal body L-ring protein FlgH